MKLSDIRATLQEIHVSPVKTLGQNFLHDQNLARWIVDQAQITSDDYVLEIGPGLGALTQLLLEKGVRILAIEKDTRLANFLRERFAHERLEILNIDALKFDARILFARRGVKLLGNLPYNISSPLLLKYICVLFLQMFSCRDLKLIPQWCESCRETRRNCRRTTKSCS
jgi:16S rRNA (adenine1518-N6/adenine1519-N6)-dimethyltransferase